ncbi:MAG TPA: PAS domain S-box protein, partial [Spirochaetota bacterium]|nr:PAS domain S-box protein [Spirochaetota bacterium]
LINHEDATVELIAWRKTGDISDGTASYRIAVPLEAKGPWSAALSARVPVIINNPSELSAYGSLPGEFRPQRRHLQVPVYYRNRIVAIAGVSDKSENYDDSDARQMTLLMNEIYRIIQQKSHDKEISEEKEKLDATLRSIADGVITVNGSGVITMFNAAAEKITGWSCHEAIGRKIADVVSVFSDRSADCSEEIIGKIRCNTLPQTVRNRIDITGKSGRRIPVEIHITPISELAGGLSGEVLVISDVSEKRKFEDAALRTSKLDSVGILAGGIAHDFNNILTSILGNISLSQESPGLPDDTEMFLKDAEKAVLRAKGLTQQLLTLSKGGDPVKSASSIGELIHEAADFALRGSNVRCEYEIAHDIPVIEIDGGQIMQVINNLVINSM